MALTALLLTSASAACRSAYYGVLEKFGTHKRDILVERVADGREDQEAAQEAFVSTFERFKELSGFAGSELESRYEALNGDYERCKSRADALRERIDSIEEVSDDLCEEWAAEIEQIQNPDMRAKSSASLEQTKVRSRELVRTMRDSAAKMDPLLVTFHDHVLFLKHNLNAQAVASLAETRVSIEADVSDLIAQMKKSIQAADDFLANMSAQP